MQRRFSALIAWIILAALVRSIAATDLVHCGQSTLPETDEIVCLGQYEENHQAPDLDNIDTESIMRVEHEDPPNFHLSSSSLSTSFVSTPTSDTAWPTPSSIATPEKAPYPKGFLHGIFCNIVDRAGHHHSTSPSVVSTPSAETDGEGKVSPKSRRNMRYTKDSTTSQKSRLFGGIRQRPPFPW